MAKLVNEKDIPNSVKDLEEQIQVRRDLISTMVGTLYPSVMEDQISRLYERLEPELEKMRKTRYVIEG